ncbi:HAD family phosphatase [uncultured Clostridium sp.]|mgnify:FL=1|uniref:HAD family hydrolase n=1 Tax=uncultured Clostridium sp. TaxID=59620 RepID=UPI00280BAC27|nr:HAD family phosphatase [uncultured Clostridium sp.]
MQQNIDKLNTVIFDMDGVLFDTEKVYLDVWTKVFEKHGYKITKEIYCKVIATGRENVKKVFKEEFGEKLPIEEMYKEKDKALEEEIKKGIPIKDGAYELLKYLKYKKYKLALATSASRERMVKQLNQSNFKHIFDAVVCRDDVKKTKPNPEIFLKAAKKLKVNPQECIVIEDSSAGVEATYKGKMTPIHVVDLKEADEKIKSYSYRSFNSLYEIKGYFMGE